jgi:hypothetical protein
MMVGGGCGKRKIDVRVGVKNEALINQSINQS